MDTHHINRLRNVILYILRDFPGGTDYIRLYKILYFANREQLARIGMPITTDKFKAWEYGPVPSYTGALVKRLEENRSLDDSQAVFKDALKVRKNKLVKALIAPDVEQIPEVSREILDKYIRKYHDKDSKEISMESHDEAWREAYEDRGGRHDGRTVINPVLMAKCGGADEMMLGVLEKSYSGAKEYFQLNTRSAKAYYGFEKGMLMLDEIAGLPEGWDGDDAFAVEPMAVVNARWILLMRGAMPEWIESIYPICTGTVCIRWRHKGGIVSVEISGVQMGFYYVSSDGEAVYDSPVYDFGQAAISDLLAYLPYIRSRR